MGTDAFTGLPDGTVTVVTSENLGSYQWNGFTATTDDPYGKLSKLEAQLATVTAERDARPTQEAYDAAVVIARTAGQVDVTSDPTSYGLVTQTNYNTMVTERDSRFVDTDKDGITDEKEAELETD